MSNFSLSQLIILLIFIFLVFGDFSRILKNVKTIFIYKRKSQATNKKNRKKGS